MKFVADLLLFFNFVKFVGDLIFVKFVGNIPLVRQVKFFFVPRFIVDYSTFVGFYSDPGFLKFLWIHYHA